MKYPVNLEIILSVIFCTLTLASCSEEITTSQQETNAMKIPETVYKATLDSPIGQGYMTINKPESWNGDVWIYFHGSYGNIDSWKNFYRQAAAHRESRDVYTGDISEPIVISLSFGEQWLLLPTDPLEPELKTFFYESILPLIRESVPPESRFTGIGYSMGGFNLLSAYGDSPELWNRIILLNPALTTISPFADRQEVIEYHRSSYLRPSTRIKILLGMEKQYPIEIIFQNERRFIDSGSQWNIVNPVFRFRRYSESESLPKTSFFIACGKNDPYGFILGARQTEEIIRTGTDSVRTVYHRSGHAYVPYAELGPYIFED